VSGTDAEEVIVLSRKSKGVCAKRFVGRIRLGFSEGEGWCVVVHKGRNKENRAGLAASRFERRPGLGYVAARIFRLRGWADAD